MILELYLVESMDKALISTPAAQKQNLSFVGEAVLRWKQCFEEKNVNNWDKLGPIYLSDDQARLQSKQILSAQLFAWMRFLELSHPDSAL